MGAFFTRPMPRCFNELRETIRGRTRNGEITRAMVEGEAAAIQAFLSGFWGFVKPFPDYIKEGCRRNAFRILTTISPGDNFRAIRRVQKMRDEEGYHSQLWLQGAYVLGLNPATLYAKPIAEVEEICRRLRSAKAFEFFLYLFTTEVIAEEISRRVIVSEQFAALMGNDGMDWWGVHAAHQSDAITHEVLDIRYAIATYKGSPEEFERRASEACKTYVDLFEAASKEALRRTRLPDCIK